MNSKYPIIADYFLYGIELGILDFAKAIDWADRVIEFEYAPSGEFVDLALSRPQGRNGVMEALKEIPGARNPQESGSLLLGDLKERLKDGEDLKSISMKALNVAWAAQLHEDDKFKFDVIDDGLALALSGTYGTVEQCKEELVEALDEYEAYQKT